MDDDTLQRYYDGDLSPLEARTVQARIEGDASAQARLAQLAKLTELLQANAKELGRSVDSSALFAAIEARVATAEKLGFGARLRVLSGEWVEHKRTTLVPLFAATAVAAATLLVVTRTHPEQVTPLDESALASAESHGTRVENVDFGSNTGTVFEIEDRGRAVAVVWITEDEETP
jgi:anti-sigma factor RsiW